MTSNNSAKATRLALWNFSSLPIGAVSGIVGAGGNVGAFLAALLLKAKSAVAKSTAVSANEAFGSDAVKASTATAASSAVGNGY